MPACTTFAWQFLVVNTLISTGVGLSASPGGVPYPNPQFCPLSFGWQEDGFPIRRKRGCHAGDQPPARNGAEAGPSVFVPPPHGVTRRRCVHNYWRGEALEDMTQNPPNRYPPQVRGPAPWLAIPPRLPPPVGRVNPPQFPQAPACWGQRPHPNSQRSSWAPSFTPFFFYHCPILSQNDNFPCVSPPLVLLLRRPSGLPWRGGGVTLVDKSKPRVFVFRGGGAVFW